MSTKEPQLAQLPLSWLGALRTQLSIVRTFPRL